MEFLVIIEYYYDYSVCVCVRASIWCVCMLGVSVCVCARARVLGLCMFDCRPWHVHTCQRITFGHWFFPSTDFRD